MVAVALLHAAFTCAMIGVIWFVQLCHYPLFALVGVEAFPAFEAAYTRSTVFVIVPLMLGELVTALWLAFGPLPGPLRPLGWWSLALLALIWASTFLVQVPLHHQLSAGFDAAIHERLVRTNWIRTTVWSGRGFLAMGLLWRALPSTH